MELLTISSILLPYITQSKCVYKLWLVVMLTFLYEIEPLPRLCVIGVIAWIVEKGAVDVINEL